MEVLNDREIRKILGTVIVDGDESCIRPNAYIMRLGSVGEFHNTGKEFELGEKKKGVVIPQGHSIGVVALETLDFTRETVKRIYPDHDLCAHIHPTTDLSRESIVAPATSVDVGYMGTLNWTLTNNAGEERRFRYGERIFRLTIYKLAEGEKPEFPYQGDYHKKTGYVRSRRAGAPVGMKDSEWARAFKKGGPEAHLQNLLSSGFPWNILGERLMAVDGQLKAVTHEYSDLKQDIDDLSRKVGQIAQNQGSSADAIREILKEETHHLENRWLIKAGTTLVALIGVSLTVFSDQTSRNFVLGNGTIIGFVLLLAAIGSLVMLSRKRR